MLHFCEMQSGEEDEFYHCVYRLVAAGINNSGGEDLLSSH